MTFAYFLWCYKEVAPPRDGPWGAFLRGPASDITAAVILGLITFSKPSHLFLIVPLLALAAHRRRFAHARGNRHCLRRGHRGRLPEQCGDHGAS